MIQLPNNCRYSGVKVTPANWQKLKKIKGPWVIYYRFYDLNTGKKLMVQERGMNVLSDLEQRQGYCHEAINLITKDIEQLQFNPITGYIAEEEPNRDYIVSPETPFIKALDKALELKVCTSETKTTIKSVVKATTAAAKLIYIDTLEVSKVSRKHIKLLLEYIGKAKKAKWTANNHNHHLSHLGMLFSDLEEWESITANPCTGIKKQKVIRARRELLTDEQRAMLYERLRADNYELWRFMVLFYSSGARLSEMSRLKKEDVNFSTGMIGYTVLKGNNPHIDRPIKDNVRQLWLQVWALALPGQYLFARGLKPNNIQMSHKHYTKLWEDKVKKKYNITADLYSLKHMHTTEIAAEYGAATAAAFNGHTSTRMVNQVYDVGKSSRENQFMKQAANEFLPASGSTPENTKKPA
jgi:integrase